MCLQHAARLTSEHVIPRWLLRAGGLDTALRLFRQPRSLAALSEAVVPVCEACNAWLNTECEQPAMPLLLDLISGKARTYSRRHQHRIAIWLYKTTLLYDLLPTL